MRPTLAALAALAAPLALAATPAAAQYASHYGAPRCDCGPEGYAGAYTETGPAYVVVPRTTYVPHTAYSRRTVLVPHTRLVPRVVYVPRTHLVPHTVEVPHTVYSVHTRYSTYPAHARAYGGSSQGYGYGATYVPPGAGHGCRLGMVGCDSGYVGPYED